MIGTELALDITPCCFPDQKSLKARGPLSTPGFLLLLSPAWYQVGVSPLFAGVTRCPVVPLLLLVHMSLFLSGNSRPMRRNVSQREGGRRGYPWLLLQFGSLTGHWVGDDPFQGDPAQLYIEASHDLVSVP